MRKLTKEQEAAIPKFIEDAWKLQTTPITKTELRKGVNTLAKVCGLKEPRDVVLLPSPKACYDYCMKNKLEESGRTYDSFSGEMFYVYSYFYDFKYYEFLKWVGEKVDADTYQVYQDVVNGLFLVAPYEDVWVCSQRPIRVELQPFDFSDMQSLRVVIDNPYGKAIEYADGTGNYLLNNVKVPEWLVTTPAEELDPSQLASIKNADVKAEFIKKIGIERLADLGKVLDSYKNYSNEWWSKSQYELIDMAPLFRTVAYAPHLRMLNQTTGVWHLEGVGPECSTIEDALDFRFGKSSKNYQIGGIK